MGRNPDHPYDGLYRMTPQAFTIRNDDNGDGRTLTGHFAVFNAVTEINGWEGNFLERLAPGAFTKTLAERGDRVKVLFNHGFDPSIGDKPLGKPDVLREDDIGGYMETPLADTSYNDDLIALIRAGAIDGMSFMFTVTRDEWDEEPDEAESPKGLPLRTIREVRLYEAGPVTFPAYEATTTGIRSLDAYRAWLRDRTRTTLDADAATPGTSATNNDDTPPSGAPVGNPARLQRIRAWRALIRKDPKLWTPSKDSGTR